MGNWTIRKQISVLSGIGMIFLVLVATVSLVAVGMLFFSFTDFKNATARTERLNLILEDLLEANGAASAFEHSADSSYATTFQNEVADILLESTTKDAVTATNADFGELLDQITQRTDGYVDQFGALEAAQSETLAQIVALSSASSAVSQALEKLASRASIDGQQGGLKQVTIAEHDFLHSQLFLERHVRTGSLSDLTTSEEWRASSETAFERAGKLLGSERYLDLVGAAQTDLDSFFAIKAKLLQALGQRNQASSGLLFSSGGLGRLVEDAVDAASDQQAEIWAQTRTNAAILAMFQAAVVFAALTILFLAARRISSQIRRTIDQTVNDMGELASGDLEILISGKDLDTEIGEMARSLEVFRRNALEARRLQLDLRKKEAEDERQRSLQLEKDRVQDEERQASITREREGIIRDLSSGLGGVVTAAANGDFSQRIVRDFGQIDLDQIVSSVNALVENVEISIAETARVLAAIAKGDLTVRMQGDYHGLFQNLQVAIDDTAITLGSVVQEISNQCDEIGSNSEQMAQQADDLSSRAETQAAALEQTSASMKELSTSVQSGAESARESSGIARQATERVNEAGKVVEASVTAMTDIKGASEKIKDIVAVMDSIAYQTNLLALNASVEAARAGEAGKGFAVVATEVRALAQRSGDASRDIKVLIEETVSQVERGVSLVEQTGNTLNDVVKGVQAMSGSMDDLTNRAQDQAASVNEVAGAVHQMDSITQKNAALADESRAISQELGNKMSVMQNLVRRFRLSNEPQSRAIAAE